MAALTPTLIQEHFLPSTIRYGGTERRLTEIYLEATSTATTNTMDLSTYVPNLSAIVSVEEMLDGAQNGGTANTWSTTTITFAGHAGSGVWVMRVLGYY